MKNIAISYAYSNEKMPTGEVDTSFLKGYIHHISSLLEQKPTIGKIWHSLIVEEDQYIERNIRKNDQLADDKKNQASLDYCKKRILEEETNIVLFILKYPLLNTHLNNISPEESEGMQQELKMVLGNDIFFTPREKIRRIVAIQEGLETYTWTNKYTTGALSILRFQDIDDLYIKLAELKIM